MLDRQQCRARLFELLRAEFDCAGQLRALLDAEANALATRDVESLERLVGDKHALMQTFETLEIRKQDLMSEAGYPAAQDIETCIRWCDESGQLLRGWHLLLGRIAHCQQQNRINGATLDSSRRHAQQVLAILRGQITTSPLYDPNGTTVSHEDGSRSLATA